ncbi:MAG TPA: hypothetical protein VLA19_30060 [Herpetosiphonaceae bacterium]|nr:hypothetical protein [Herpetosiphonaceae bacterium]
MPLVADYKPPVRPELEAEAKRIDTPVKNILRDYMEIVGKRKYNLVSYPKTISKPYSYYWKAGEDDFSVQVYLYLDKPKGLLGRLGNYEDPHLHVLISDSSPPGADIIGQILSRETGLPVKLSSDTLRYDDEANRKVKVQAEYSPDGST